MTKEIKKIYANVPQVQFMAIPARYRGAILGRAIGKTEGLSGNHAIDCMESMPKSFGVLVLPKLEDLELIMGGIFKAFYKLGYENGVDFTYGVEPPWQERPYSLSVVKSYKRLLCFKNGSALMVVTSKSAYNGSSIDFLIIEEAKLVRDKFYREIIPAIRGHSAPFGHLWQHGSVLAVTDRPRANDYQWIYNFDKPFKEPKNQQTLLAMDYVNDSLRDLLKDYQHADNQYPSAIERIEKEITKQLLYKNELAKKLTYIQESSTLENIDALGVDTIIGFLNTLTANEFAVSVLNYKPLLAEHRFYPNFNPQVQAYISDNDITEAHPMHIALDYNAAICCLEVGQYYNGELRIVRSLDSLTDIEELLEQFANLFEKRKNRIVFYYYDHTAKQGKSASKHNKTAYYEIVAKELRKHKFNVVPMYVRSYTHDARHKLFKEIFSTGNQYLEFKYNAKYCENLALSIAGAAAIVKMVGTKSEVAKDKSPETNKTLDQRQTTHHSEALDGLVTGIIYSNEKKKNFQSV